MHDKNFKYAIRGSRRSSIVLASLLAGHVFVLDPVLKAEASDLIDTRYSSVESALSQKHRLIKTDSILEQRLLEAYEKYIGVVPKEKSKPRMTDSRSDLPSAPSGADTYLSSSNGDVELLSAPPGVPDPRPFDMVVEPRRERERRDYVQDEVKPRQTDEGSEDRKKDERLRIPSKKNDKPKMPVIVRLAPGETPGELPPGFVYDPEQIAELQKKLAASEEELKYWREIDRRGHLMTGVESGAVESIKGDTFYSKMRLYDFDGFSIAVLYDGEKPRAFSFALAPDGYEPWDQMTFFFPARAMRPMIDMLNRAQERYRELKLGERLGSMIRKTNTGGVGLEIFKGPSEGRVVLSEHCRVRGGDRMEFHKMLMREAGLSDSREIALNLKLYEKAYKTDPAFAGRFYGSGMSVGNAKMEMDIGRLSDMARALKRFLPDIELRRPGIPSELRDERSVIKKKRPVRKAPVRIVRQKRRVYNDTGHDK